MFKDELRFLIKKEIANTGKSLLENREQADAAFTEEEMEQTKVRMISSSLQDFLLERGISLDSAELEDFFNNYAMCEKEFIADINSANKAKSTAAEVTKKTREKKKKLRQRE